jgi:hypothetical protein
MTSASPVAVVVTIERIAGSMGAATFDDGLTTKKFFVTDSLSVNIRGTENSNVANNIRISIFVCRVVLVDHTDFSIRTWPINLRQNGPSILDHAAGIIKVNYIWGSESGDTLQIVPTQYFFETIVYDLSDYTSPPWDSTRPVDYSRFLWLARNDFTGPQTDEFSHPSNFDEPYDIPSSFLAHQIYFFRDDVLGVDTGPLVTRSILRRVDDQGYYHIFVGNVEGDQDLSFKIGDQP